MEKANERLLKDWERARKSEGFRPMDRNRKVLEMLEAHAGGVPLDTLDRDTMRDWVGSLDGYAASSRLTYFSCARAFFNFLEHDEIITLSPMHGMKEPKNPSKPVLIPPEDDMRRLLETVGADKSAAGRRDHAVIRIMMDTGGPRATEVAEMLIYGEAPRPRDTLGLDLDRDCITVIGKGDKTRTWPISARTARTASQWLRTRDKLKAAAGSPRLWVQFRARAGGGWTRSGVQDMLERRCDQAGIKRVHPHQLRHFSYHHFLLKGGKLNDAKLLYGWDDDTMPQRYASGLAAERALEAGHTLAIGDQW